MVFLASDWINIIGIILNLSALFYVSSRIQSNITSRRFFKDYIIKEITELRNQYYDLFSAIEKNDFTPKLVRFEFIQILSSNNALKEVLDRQNESKNSFWKFLNKYVIDFFEKHQEKKYIGPIFINFLSMIKHSEKLSKTTLLFDTIVDITIALQVKIEEEPSFNLNYKSQKKYKSSLEVKSMINNARSDFAVSFHELCININKA